MPTFRESFSLKKPTIAQSLEELQLEPRRRQRKAGTMRCGLEERKETSLLAKMKDRRTIQETPGFLQSEVRDQEDKMEEQAQEEDAHANLSRTQPPSVHFFSSMTNSDITALPSSWSLSTEMPLSYSLSSPQISGVNIPTIAPKALKSTTVSHSQSESSLGVNSFIIPKKKTVLFHASETAVTGEGEDYFLSLFGNSKTLCAHSSHTEKTWKHFSIILEEMSQSRSSCCPGAGVQNEYVLNAKGLFVRLINSSVDKELEIGNHILQQKVNGQTVCLYRFLSNITMQANSTVTVWAAASEAKHQPPSDFLWKEENKFTSIPNCTTILCKPNGE
ncbi:PREDICTED: lamin tail domain-containing protein 1, partial [Hipposideros armiger]|uniref:Lamin tail domain-containing protein 1 n=1 Tax=Hipposideros armiger TaxID=186990 RepID=A0A8B7PZ33_HIPAR